MSKPGSSKKDKTARTEQEKSVQTAVNGEEDFQEESLEEILLQELLQKTSQLQKIDGELAEIRQELEISRKIMATQSSGVLFVDRRLRISYANNLFCSMIGRDLPNLKERKLDQFVMFAEQRQNLETVLQKAMHWGSWSGEVLLREDNGEQVTMTMSVNYRDQEEENDSVDGFACRFSLPDTTVPQSDHHSFPHISYDALTGLPDRPSFQHHFSFCISQARAKHSQVGLLFVDLDHFKRINRMLGPGVGDELLCSVTALLKRCGKAAGADFVARLSGDEFAIILPPPTNTQQAEDLAGKILQKFRQPVTIKSRDIFVTPSIGISLYPGDGESPPELLRNADTAMEMAKARGGNTHCHWHSDMDTQAVQNLHLENDLRKAVANGELYNHYQPQIDLTNGVIVGMEALARWEHPVHGNISPVIFIPIAENTGLIEELGLDLVRLACQEGRKWLNMGFKNFTMAVNLSGSLLRRNDLFEQIMDCLEDTGFPPTSLEVEFTESVLIENMDNTMDLITKCREQGIMMAIDDFGTGYSSLSYLQRFAVDKIKIDRSFIMDVTTNASDAAITMAIIAIAKKLNFQVLAEGVETEEQLFFLQENQCDECQGFLFSRPITAKQMTNLLMRDSSVALKHKRIIDKFYSIKAQSD